MEPRIQTFAEFWPHYLGEHRVPLCRQLHFVGTSLALTAVVVAIASADVRLAPLPPLCGYGWAWVGHFLVEKNQPATFRYPLWSLLADFRLWGLMLRGQLWTGDPARQ